MGEEVGVSNASTDNKRINRWTEDASIRLSVAPIR